MLQQPVTSHEPQAAQPSQLSSRLDKNLLAYALAASAAGVGVLAAAEPAEARILAMPVNISIPENGGIIQFDINRDGVPDFGLSANFYEFAATPPPLGAFSSWLKVVPAQDGNEVWEVGSNQISCAEAVHAGNLISGRRPFKPGPLLMVFADGSATRGRSSLCPWHGTHPPYLGLKFMINGEVHYGWARVISAIRNTVLTGFAYETIPNKPIIAGATQYKDDLRQLSEVIAAPVTQQKSLGMLALGSQELVACRKREDETEPAD
jgi:hypothetical protein